MDADISSDGGDSDMESDLEEVSLLVKWGNSGECFSWGITSETTTITLR